MDEKNEIYEGYSSMQDDFAAEEVEGDLQIRPYEVDCLPNDYNITTLISLIERGYMKIPSFQRNYVWKKDMASKFIESIIIGLPIPQLFLFERERNNFLVIDGQQRLVTIYLFKKQRFPKNDDARMIIRKYLSNGENIPDELLAGDNFEDFKLKLPGLDEEKNPLDKLKYDTLSTIKEYDFKGEFDFNRTIRTITIKQVSPSDDNSSMFEIFSRLNSGGVMLRPQEIRMSIYYSEFYEKLLSCFNINKDWRRFLGKADPDLHMMDIEVLVRVFALFYMEDKYKSPLKVFLNEFSRKAMEFDEKTIANFERIYEDFWKACADLPDNIFRNDQNKFVISFFEAVFVAVANKLENEENVNGLRISIESINKLKNDTNFYVGKQGGIASAASVSNRLNLAREVLVMQSR